jgi:WD40 repeat protein
METRTLRGHRDEVSSIGFSPDGQLLLSGAKDGEVKTWRTVYNPPERNALNWPKNCHLYAVAPDASAAAALHDDSRVTVWELPNLRQVVTQALDPGYAKPDLFELAPHGKRLAFATPQGLLAVSDIPSLSEIARAGIDRAGIALLKFSPKGKFLALAGASPSIILRDPDSLRPVATLARNENSPVQVLAFSPGETLCVAGTFDGAVEAWDLTNQRRFALPRHRDLKNLAIFPDGSSLATVGGDAHMRIWDLSTRTEKLMLGKTLNIFNSIAIAPNGLRVATGDNSSYVTLWDPVTGFEIGRFAGNGPLDLIFSPDSTTLVGTTRRNLRLWRAPSWAEIAAAEQSLHEAPSNQH